MKRMCPYPIGWVPAVTELFNLVDDRLTGLFYESDCHLAIIPVFVQRHLGYRINCYHKGIEPAYRAVALAEPVDKTLLLFTISDVSRFSNSGVGNGFGILGRLVWCFKAFMI